MTFFDNHYPGKARPVRKYADRTEHYAGEPQHRSTVPLTPCLKCGHGVHKARVSAYGDMVLRCKRCQTTQQCECKSSSVRRLLDGSIVCEYCNITRMGPRAFKRAKS